MARKYRLWAERSKESGVVVGCGLEALTKREEREPPTSFWEQLGRFDSETSGGSWDVLLRLLNMDRRFPPSNWPIDTYWLEQNPDWEDWKSFGCEVGAPYFLTDDQGHPLLWFPTTDREWYGILFDFGLVEGQWHWWVPGTERYEVESDGSVRIIMGERHDESPGGKTIRDFVAGLPPAYFNVDTETQLSLQEAIEGELRRHSQEEVDRCRFFAYHPLSPAHGSHSKYGELGLQTLEDVRYVICSFAWTWLSPHVAFWNPFIVTDWRLSIGGHANPDPRDPKTERKLTRLRPQQRFARTVTQIGRDPLEFWLQRLEKISGVSVDRATRNRSSLNEKARDNRHYPNLSSSGDMPRRVR